MSYLERLQAKAAMNAPSAPAKGAKAPSDPFEGDPTGCFTDLPSELGDGLRRLAIMPTPRLIRPEVWPGAVADALRLARDGWASKALALGWSPLDLFGTVTERDGYADADGLAVSLAGRSVLVIGATYAFVGQGSARSYFNRCDRLGETLLWEVGR